MSRITGFHQDDEGFWIAELECGHTRHVRHDPPWQERPWVVTEAGRREHIGDAVECIECRTRGRSKEGTMTNERWFDVDRYINGLFVADDPALDEALEASANAGLPAIQVSPSQGKLLHVLARSCGARRILEIGTLGGYSTIWLARALPPGGLLVTLESEVRHAEVARANIARADIDATVEVRVGRALDTLPQLVTEGAGPFDLVFLDADKENYPDYLEWSLQLTAPGSLIVADNVVRGGKVVDRNSDDSAVRGVRRFNEWLSSDPRVAATVVQTVGSKGHDGLAFAVVTGA